MGDIHAKKKVKLSKSAKGALPYMLIALFIFAALETAVYGITWHYDESNAKAYTGILSCAEQYTICAEVTGKVFGN